MSRWKFRERESMQRLNLKQGEYINTYWESVLDVRVLDLLGEDVVLI